MITTTSVIEKVWKPNPGKQSLFLSLPDSIFEQFYGGAAGGGKSEIILMKPILREWINNPRFQGLILRRTFTELEESLIERSKRGGRNKDGTEIPSFYDFGATFNEQKKKWRFASGATITFGHAQEESDVRKYDTAEFQYIGFDELTSFTEFQYKFLAFSRCRSTDASIPANVCSASNPGNIGHRWVRERFVEPCINGGKILSQKFGDTFIKRIFIQAFLADNPKLMENDPAYRARLEMMPEAEKRAKLYGDWWTFSGQVFAEWRVSPFPDEPENAQHVIAPMIPHSSLPRILAIDWGYTAMTFGIFGVPLPDKHGLIYREYKTLDKEGKVIQKTVKQWTTDLANICLMEGINPYIYMDPSAWQNRGQGTIESQFTAEWRKVMGRSPRLQKANNDRVGGKMMIHDYLRWQPRAQFVKEINEVYDRAEAEWILRNRGVAAHQAYLNSFIPVSDTIEEDLPRIKITSDCTELIKTIPLCVYNEKGNLEDVQEFSGDDPYDDFRYFIEALETFNVKDLPAIQEALQTDDMSAFYRKMEFLEAKEKQKKANFISVGRRGRRHASYR